MHPTPQNPPYDPRRAAWQLERRTRGRWLCWWGPHNGRFFAMPARGQLLLAEGDTIHQLAERMTEVDAYTGRQLDGSFRP